MINNLIFLIKIIRIFKKYDILKLIINSVKFKFLFILFTEMFSLGVNKLKELSNESDGIRIAKALNELGPSFIKLGQLISTRPDIIGNEIAEDMSLLRDNLPPFPRSEAIEIIQKEFGKNINEIFQDFSEPIAAASIAQVHFANIYIGKEITPVAVKVLRPNIIEIINNEMERLSWLSNFMQLFQDFKRLRPKSIIEKAKEVIKFELDFRYEAAAASELSENTKKDESFYVPKVYWDQVTKKVLTIERIEGIPADKINLLRKENINTENAARNLIQNFLRQSIRDGYFHADLHQGNLFISKDGNLNAVDFGIMGRLDKKNRTYLAEIIYGFITQDYLKIAKIHQEAGLIDKNQSIEDFSQALRSIGEPIINQKAKNISMGNLLIQLFEITQQFNMSLQPQLLLLQKTMITVEGVARKLDPEIDFWAVSKPEIEKWLKDELGVVNRLKQTQESLQSIARRIPELPDFINRADAAFDIITNKNEENKTSDNAKIYFIGSGAAILVLVGLIILI
tara:strand:+ start:1541 stop:3073 length:1533 start_codon:yes stop_codon:yes gene_type:complete